MARRESAPKGTAQFGTHELPQACEMHFQQFLQYRKCHNNHEQM